jgi:hypothetical protein
VGDKLRFKKIYKTIKWIQRGETDEGSPISRQGDKPNLPVQLVSLPISFQTDFYGLFENGGGKNTPLQTKIFIFPFR